MSRYDLEQAGMTDVIGSKSPPAASELAMQLADLGENEPRPETCDVIVTEGKNHMDRLVYAIRLSMTVAPPELAIHYWTEADYLTQSARLEDRRRWSLKGNDEAVDDYEVNRLIFEEREAVSYLLFDGLGGSSGHYRYGEVRAITELLDRRMRDPLCCTFVVTALNSMPEFYEYAQFREVVAPMFEFFDLV